MAGLPSDSPVGQWRPALFASAFHPHVGGVEELVQQLAGQQQRSGNAPLVVTNRFPKDLPASAVVSGLPVRRFSFRVPEPTVRQFGGWALYSSATKRDVIATLREHDANVVHVQCVSSNSRYALSAARRMKLPLVVSLQGELSMDATSVYQRSSQLRRNWQALLDRADVVTACSRYVMDEAEHAYGGAFRERGVVVYNGVRLEDFQKPAATADRPFVLAIGRHVWQKGFDVLLRAFALAHPVGIDLVIAGDGPENAVLKTLAHELGLGTRVRFPGRVTHEQAVQLFQQALVFVLPSRHEPQGIVVLEAMAAGTPVIAAAVGGVPEIVTDGINGLLYRSEDVQHLADRLLVALRHRSGRLASAGLLTAATMTWHAIALQYEACYEQALRRRSRFPPSRPIT